jgi:hypothetical protein
MSDNDWRASKGYPFGRRRHRPPAVCRSTSAPGPVTKSDNIKAREAASSKVQLSGLHHAVRIVDRICSVTGSIDFTSELQVGGSRLRRILNRRDNAKLFGWLVEAFSHQGVSDQLADDYMQRHGRLTWTSVSGGVAARVVCPKLNSRP